MSAKAMECSKLGNYTVNTPNEDVVLLTIEKQKELLGKSRLECLIKMKEEPTVLQGSFCPRIWDNVMCWGDTRPGVTVCQQCPGYINNMITSQFASRTCLPGGVWGSDPGWNTTSPYGWTNFSACLSKPSIDLPPESAEEVPGVPNVIVDHIKKMRVMYNIGYGLSLVSLMLAFFIMVYFRKLHCSRNTIHLNLFASFILRASISLVRDNVMVGPMGVGGAVHYNDTTGNMVFTDQAHWECRLFYTVANYTVVSSYFWICMEAVFLHMLIYVNVLSEKIRVIWYIVFGWSIPLVVVIMWAIMRLRFDNYLCWNTHTRLPGLVWIIEGPIMLTVVFNFLFFISILRTLYTKLSASKCLDSKRSRYRRMTKSVLLLIPVFGVYYVVFTIPLDTFGETAGFVMLFIEMFFNSYQGFFIATVLCFINQEVRTEIQRAWKQRQLRHGSLAGHVSRVNSNHVNVGHETIDTCCNVSPNKLNGKPIRLSQTSTNDSHKTLHADSLEHDENTPFIKTGNGSENSKTGVHNVTHSNSTEFPLDNNVTVNGNEAARDQIENGVKTDVQIHSDLTNCDVTLEMRELRLTNGCDRYKPDGYVSTNGDIVK